MLRCQLALRLATTNMCHDSAHASYMQPMFLCFTYSVRVGSLELDGHLSPGVRLVRQRRIEGLRCRRQQVRGEGSSNDNGLTAM